MDGTMATKKIVVIGDGNCGKTCLLIKYVSGQFEENYIPTVFDQKEVTYRDDVTGQEILLSLWDTAGQEDYDRVRVLSYVDTDLLLVCFALNSVRSLESIGERWNEEIEHFCKRTPRILVGMKADLRKKSDANLITQEKAIEMAKYISARSYIECSSFTGQNVEEVFHQAVDVLMNRKRKKAKSNGCRTA
ncbi:Ras-like protein gene family, member A [Nematocida homosporus]|uniref:Ras-like protein gene family, member A n=1 Tax=Nematocida homosporus TaxID=1912981 RepID=UPI0022207542|nr:Ras-like protein gene family, member A [Nematocida homosporus]KAI5187799.1 Ras-like protein gene family, member A [Nematocida homosporus]